MQHPRQVYIIYKQRLPGEEAGVFIAFYSLAEELGGHVNLP